MQEKQENSLLSENLTILLVTLLTILGILLTRLGVPFMLIWFVAFLAWFVRVFEFIEERNALEQQPPFNELQDAQNYNKTQIEDVQKEKKAIEIPEDGIVDWGKVQYKNKHNGC
ncbi:MAG: hypothetical protein IPJ74_26460 [Saprospiraceae bacterium]|nr:hypothetical protein [Saprospiraceae bacterium]